LIQFIVPEVARFYPEIPAESQVQSPLTGLLMEYGVRDSPPVAVSGLGARSFPLLACFRAYRLPFRLGAVVFPSSGFLYRCLAS
jgi:hypothetical protein